MYVMFVESNDKVKGIAVLTESIKQIEKVIVAKGGAIKVTAEPRATTTDEDAELEALKEKVREEQREVDGDESE